ncbi:MAG: response regulator transcription factor [Bacillota bacterium]|jgi:two-component system, OmpR family, response regulator ResD|uniref:response regulator transcription factor n=1 Tax=Fictibacillus TaxID=1329200 RepID=UPI0018CE5F13|nr:MULTISPECIES: response regulator transcription factor [unclassified Fictibacillus]MBH0157165.1 response regulator transcription factor [Fictibacillus sp. 5RED26]MBH0159486.1 response regulator transcription factor [Fictibacillus sp. 26RED30]MBH0163715.1 response regulator transcription factor [Fictibacillus sp. 7GRE50]MBH0169659.1 response regulator transcription factor [Fictibacillus sp. 18YEL24]MBH0174159.1 response regulator transcription factor [Fictibacillus sp. 23RED33]
MYKKTILIIDDDWDMRNLLRIYLRDYYHLLELDNGQRALDVLTRNKVDLVILDIMMPEIDGWEICMRIREKSTTPVLMLTALSDVQDKIMGLNIGADDYITKPFEPDELLARVQALLRRVSYLNTMEKKENEIIIEDLTINIRAREVFANEKSVNFTPKETELLIFLANNPRQVMTREVLLNKIWGEYYSYDGRVVDTHVKNIRVKLREKGLSFDPIKTVWGVGYKFSQPGEQV